MTNVRRRSRAGVAGLVVVAGIVAVVIAAIGLGTFGPGGTGSGATGSPPRSPAATPTSGPAGPTGAPPASPTAPAAAASQGASPGVVGETVEGPGYTITLPADEGLAFAHIGDSDIWFGGGDTIRGVFVAPVDLADATATLEAAIAQLAEDLEAIPGADPATAPEAVSLPAGDALRIDVPVGEVRFVGFVVLHGSEALSIVVVNYPEDVTDAVARSLVLR